MATSHHSIISAAIDAPDPDETPVSVSAEAEPEDATPEGNEPEAESPEAPDSEAVEPPEEGNEGETEETPEAEGEEGAEGEGEAEAEPEEESEVDPDAPVTDEELERVGETRRISKERFEKIYPFYNKAKELRITSPDQLDELVETYQEYTAIESALLGGDREQTAAALIRLGNIDGRGTAVDSIIQTLPEFLLKNYQDGYRDLGRDFYGRLLHSMDRAAAGLEDENEQRGMKAVVQIVRDHLAKFQLLSKPEPKDPEAKAEREQTAQQRMQQRREIVDETNAVIDEKLGALVEMGLKELTENPHFPQKDAAKVKGNYLKLVTATMQEDKLGMARIHRLRRIFEANPTKENRKAYAAAYVSMGLAAVKATQSEYLTLNTRKIVQANNQRVEDAKRSAKKRSVAPSVRKPASVKLPATKRPAMNVRDVLFGDED